MPIRQLWVPSPPNRFFDFTTPLRCKGVFVFPAIDLPRPQDALMQPFDFLCTHCHGTLRVSIPELVGRRVRCPHCRQSVVVVEPAVDSYSQWAEQTAEGQLGSSSRLTSGSGLALADADGADDIDQQHVWGDDHHTEDVESVLGGETAQDWRGETTRSNMVEAAEASPMESAEREAEAVVEIEDAGEFEDAGEAQEAEEPSVDFSVPRASQPRSYSSYSAPRTYSARATPSPLVIVAAAIGVLLMIVAVGMIATGKGPGSGARGSNGKVQRRNPQEFQDFARDAARRGWR